MVKALRNRVQLAGGGNQGIVGLNTTIADVTAARTENNSRHGCQAAAASDIKLGDGIVIAQGASLHARDLTGRTLREVQELGYRQLLPALRQKVGYSQRPTQVSNQR